MTKPPRRSPIKRTIDEDELIASQIRLSPGKSPKKFLQVGIVTCSLDHVTLIDETIRTKERSRLTMSLIKSYSLFQRLTFIPLVPAEDSDLLTAHSAEYVDAIKRSKEDAFEDEFGLSYDCPPQDDLYERCTLIAGSTLSAARTLTSGKLKVAINWHGGWHHARRGEAAGFCYVNDINIAIKHLLLYSKRILYIDLDLHHGDGVEEEFKTSKQVATFSLHHYADGFYPGTGGPVLNKTGGFSINAPLPERIGDADWLTLAKYGVSHLIDAFDPQYLVVQCGADALFNDPHKSTSLSQSAYLSLIEHVKRFARPMLILGGGGYNETASAKLWANVTAKLCGLRLVDDIPDTDDYFERYGPDFTVHETNELFTAVPREKLESIKNHILRCCTDIKTHRKANQLCQLPKRPAFKRRKLILD